MWTCQNKPPYLKLARLTSTVLYPNQKLLANKEWNGLQIEFCTGLDTTALMKHHFSHHYYGMWVHFSLPVE